EMLEIVVPPEDRVLSVDVHPSAEKVKPGAKVKLDVQIKDAAGKPYVGSLAIAVYDKAVEYISGGSNAGDIREIFWKWRRSHSLQRETNLDASGDPMVPQGQPSMGFLGVFGQFVAEEDERQQLAGSVGGTVRKGGTRH